MLIVRRITNIFLGSKILSEILALSPEKTVSLAHMTALNQTHFSVIFSDNSEILLLKTFTENQLIHFFKQPHGVFLFDFHSY